MSSSARMALASSTARESAQPARPERPTENQIAALAYQLWVAKGCPLGTNREDWLLAEARLAHRSPARSGNEPFSVGRAMERA